MAPVHAAAVAARNALGVALRVFDPPSIAAPMELETRRQRRKDRKEAMMGVRSIHDLPDDLLRRILLRLDSPLWLIRAARVCTRWRRAVTDGDDEGRAFLRLARSLHPPTVAGQYHDPHASGHIRFVPSSTSPIDGSRFSVDDFLLDKQQHSSWHVADCHGGLVLLSMRCEPCADLVVYDPLARKQRWISGPPTGNEKGFTPGSDVFLLDGDDGHISMSNFKVLHRRLNPAPTAGVFSRGDGGEWGWRLLSRRLSDEDLFPRCSLYLAGRVDGSLYLGLTKGSRIIAFDSTSLVFSMIDLPTRVRVDTNTPSRFRSPSSFTVVHGAAGGLDPASPPRTSIVHVSAEELELFRRVQGSGEWVLERTIANLSEATRGLSAAVCQEMEKKKKGIEWRTMAGVMADGAALAILAAYPSYDYIDDRWFFSNYFNERWFFSIDVNTMELRVLQQELYRQTTEFFNYTLPWPQFLQACT